MKNWGLFLGGVATGVILTFLTAFILYYSSNGSNPSGVTNFDQPGQVVHESSVKVMQVVADNAALVRGKNDSSDDWYFGPIYLLRNYDGKYYTDDEIIRVADGKVFRQTGVYKYEAKSGDYQTVAIIEIKYK